MKLAPRLADTLRQKRHGAVGTSWYVDETYIKVQGRWSYLYQAIDREGNLIDARLSNTRDLVAAEAFFRSAWRVTGVVPARLTTDGHTAYPGAIRAVFGHQVTHRTNRYLNNHLEQDHRESSNGTAPQAASAPFYGPSHATTSGSRSHSDGRSIRNGLPR